MKVLRRPARLWDAWVPAPTAACPEMALMREGDPAGFDALIYAPGLVPRMAASWTLPLHLKRGSCKACGRGRKDRDQPDPDPALVPDGRSGLARGMTEYCTGWAMRRIWAWMPARRTAFGSMKSCRRWPPTGASPFWAWASCAAPRPRRSRAGLRRGGLVAPGSSGRRHPHPARCRAGDALSRAEILICLLPDTAQTRNLLNDETLALLSRAPRSSMPGAAR